MIKIGHPLLLILLGLVVIAILTLGILPWIVIYGLLLLSIGLTVWILWTAILGAGFQPTSKMVVKKMLDMTVDLMVTKQSQGLSPYTNPVRALSLSLAYNTIAHKLQIKPGTVGRPVLWTEEKIAEDGEILVKGPQVFKGYWNLPDATKEAFTEDGWFKTGDIGEFDSDGFLRITDRKKELFVTSGGKNIAPHPIELAIIGKPYIDQACLIGDARKYICALVVPDYQELRRYCKHNGIPEISNAELIAHEKIKALLQKQIDEVNETLPRYEQIKYYRLMENPFSIESGELTPTLKLKRRIVLEKYKSEIESMYQG